MRRGGPDGGRLVGEGVARDVLVAHTSSISQNNGTEATSGKGNEDGRSSIKKGVRATYIVVSWWKDNEQKWDPSGAAYARVGGTGHREKGQGLCTLPKYNRGGGGLQSSQELKGQ